jgi:hypothetical protein
MNISPFVDPICGILIFVSLSIGIFMIDSKARKIIRRLDDIESKLNGIDRKTVSKSAAPSKPGIRIRLH